MSYQDSAGNSTVSMPITVFTNAEEYGRHTKPKLSLQEEREGLKAGDYTLNKNVAGKTEVSLVADDIGRITNMIANFSDYSDYKEYVVKVHQNITNSLDPDNSWINDIHWYSDLVGTGAQKATKKTTKAGYHLQIEIIVNDFQAERKPITTVDGVSYEPPTNGT
ncbi:hypothetical protein NW762_010102 [Fusarium torreyae]|uniref:Uncharacterized protein n=1 Tax=Fusarium torreyae TaxID=1237075 RepID=A0A9W8VAT4_9HYPO|nr:hypothetical protein NW762_010102 [Fusarium torreyae]